VSLTVCSTFGGYEYPYLQRYVAALRDLHICSDSPEILFLDNSLSPAFHEVLMDASRTIPGYVRVLDERLRVADPQELWQHRLEQNFEKWTPGSAADFTSRRDIQVALMYQRARNEIKTQHGNDEAEHWVLLVESDVLPPPDTFWRLVEVMEHAPLVGAISANIPYETDMGARIRTMAWRMPAKLDHGFLAPEPPGDPVVWHDPPSEDFDGPEVVDGISFGCTLMRLSTMLRVPLRTTWPPVQGYGFDQVFCRNLREELGMYCMVHWGVLADHIKLQPDGTYRGLRDVQIHSAN